LQAARLQVALPDLLPTATKEVEHDVKIMDIHARMIVTKVLMHV
jgi:hypothetical protein